MTHVSMLFGPRLIHIVIDGEKAAVTNRDGRWETVSLADQGYSSAGFSASIARSVQTPVEEANALASSLTSLQQEEDAVVGTLPADVAKSRLDMRRGSDDMRDPKGTVHFSIRDGVLTKYEVRVEGQRVDENRTLGVSRKITVQLSDVGAAKFDLPSGAAEALERPVPTSEPRLSDAEEAALLSLRGKRDVDVHDPSSLVKCDGVYWFFSTGTGVSSWHSKDLRNWQRGPRVFPEIPDWVTEIVSDQRGQRKQQYEIAGHEFFSADGQWVWYDLQTPRADQFWLAGVHVHTGERIGYRLTRDQWSVHYNISRNGKLFAGDGGGRESVANQSPLPEKRRLDPPGNNAPRSKLPWWRDRSVSSRFWLY